MAVAPLPRQRVSRRVGAGSDHIPDHPDNDRVDWVRLSLHKLGRAADSFAAKIL